MTQIILNDHSAAKASGNTDAQEKTLLMWMIDNAEPHQESLHALVSTQLALTVAGVYSSSQVTSHLLVLLASNPQYITELREEIAESYDDMGNIDPGKLPKMEACLSETLRLNPPLLSESSITPFPFIRLFFILIDFHVTDAPQRLAMRSVTLRDGTTIPKGALVAFPCLPASMDTSIYPDPQHFLPFRKSNLSLAATTTTKSKLAFGWGVQACPGRFFAVKEIKVLAARLLMAYDMEITPESAKLRRYYDIEDMRVLNPSIRLRMRRRVAEGE